MTTPTVTTYTVTSGQYEGLVIRTARLASEVAVQVTHNLIEGFEARASMPEGTNHQDVFNAVVKFIRLAC